MLVVIAIVPKKNPKIINVPFIRSLNIKPKLVRALQYF